MIFKFNSELYADPGLAEGVDYARRHCRHERFDDALARTDDVPKTTILAPHGGGIEPGTSELCLAVAGYHPASLSQIPPVEVTYDYWMFEGLREHGNPRLHVTSTGCDDGVAVSLCAGSLNALTLHGFLPQPPMSEDDQVVLVGGGNPDLRCHLLEGLCAAGSTRGTPARRGSLTATPRATSSTAPCSAWARSWSSAGRCAMRCSPSTPARGASTPPPSCSGPSWRRAATRSTGSKPGRSRPGPALNAAKMTRVKWGAGNNGAGNRVRPSRLLNIAWPGRVLFAAAPALIYHRVGQLQPQAPVSRHFPRPARARPSSWAASSSRSTGPQASPRPLRLPRTGLAPSPSAAHGLHRYLGAVRATR